MKKSEQCIYFKPRYSPAVNLKVGDSFDYQVCGIDDCGEDIMYNDLGEVIEENGKLKISWNGARFESVEFFNCAPWGGETFISHLRVCSNKLIIKT